MEIKTLYLGNEKKTAGCSLDSMLACCVCIEHIRHLMTVEILKIDLSYMKGLRFLAGHVNTLKL